MQSSQQNMPATSSKKAKISRREVDDLVQDDADKIESQSSKHNSRPHGYDKFNSQAVTANRDFD